MALQQNLGPQTLQGCLFVLGGSQARGDCGCPKQSHLTSSTSAVATCDLGMGSAAVVTTTATPCVTRVGSMFGGRFGEGFLFVTRFAKYLAFLQFDFTYLFSQ